jgi:hypothetical protein
MTAVKHNEQFGIEFGGIENYESKNSIGNRRRFIGKG